MMEEEGCWDSESRRESEAAVERRQAELIADALFVFDRRGGRRWRPPSGLPGKFWWGLGCAGNAVIEFGVASCFGKDEETLGALADKSLNASPLFYVVPVFLLLFFGVEAFQDYSSLFLR